MTEVMRTGTRRTRRGTVAVLLLALVAAACGQKPGIQVAANQGGVDVGAQSDFASLDDGGVSSLDDAAGQVGSSGGTQKRTVTQIGGGSTGDAGTAGVGAGTGTGGGGTGGGGTGGGGGGGGGTTAQPRGTDMTGLTPAKITLAIHAPATGAAPLPTTSFERYGDLYWRWITEVKKEKVLGRGDVEVLFRDDKYTPSSARQVCREMMSKAFIVIGGGGTDQVQACGDLANSNNVPYVSAGVTERGLRGLPWYFAVSMSYKQQGELLAQWVKKQFPNKKTAMIVTDTPNFDDAVEGWEAAAARHGIPYYKTLKHPKGDTSWYNSYGNDLQENGVKVVYFLSSPVDYIQFAKVNDDAAFQFVGVGVTQGLNAIMSTGCPAIHGGTFFSPFPGLDKADELAPGFNQAAEALGMAAPDDIALALWVTNAAIHEVFKRYEATFGTRLTREDFRALLETQRGITTGVGPELNYSPQDHFGARQVHVLKANCDEDVERYETVPGMLFKSGF